MATDTNVEELNFTCLENKPKTQNNNHESDPLKSPVVNEERFNAATHSEAENAYSGHNVHNKVDLVDSNNTKMNKNATSGKELNINLLGGTVPKLSPGLQPESSSIVQSVDPQLHLLDFQLRNILKPSGREEGQSFNDSCHDVCKIEKDTKKKGKDGSEDQFIVGEIKEKSEMMDGKMERKSGEFRSSKKNSAFDIGNLLDFNASESRMTLFDSKDFEFLTKKDLGMHIKDDEPRAESSLFGSTVTTNMCPDEYASTNANVDDHATRAAPFTMASIFASLGFSEDESDIDEPAAVKNEESPNLRLSASASCDRNMGFQFMKIIEVSREKLSEKINQKDFSWKRNPVQDSFTAAKDSLIDVNVANNNAVKGTRESNEMRRKDKLFKYDSNKPLHLNHMDTPYSPADFSKTSFDIRSPSSPARLSNSMSCFMDQVGSIYDGTSSQARLHAATFMEKRTEDSKRRFIQQDASAQKHKNPIISHYTGEKETTSSIKRFFESKSKKSFHSHMTSNITDGFSLLDIENDNISFDVLSRSIPDSTPSIPSLNEKPSQEMTHFGKKWPFSSNFDWCLNKFRGTSHVTNLEIDKKIQLDKRRSHSLEPNSPLAISLDAPSVASSPEHRMSQKFVFHKNESLAPSLQAR